MVSEPFFTLRGVIKESWPSFSFYALVQVEWKFWLYRQPKSGGGMGEEPCKLNMLEIIILVTEALNEWKITACQSAALRSYIVLHGEEVKNILCFWNFYLSRLKFYTRCTCAGTVWSLKALVLPSMSVKAHKSPTGAFSLAVIRPIKPRAGPQDWERFLSDSCWLNPVIKPA